MKKIFFVIFSIILFSVSFSETTYKVTTDKGVKLKKEEISQNNSQIEAQLAAFFNPQTYDADKIKKSVLNITDAPTKEEDILINSMSSFIKTYISKSKYNIGVSLFTTKKDIDCSALAKKYGGGGHEQAAGFGADRIEIKDGKLEFIV